MLDATRLDVRRRNYVLVPLSLCVMAASPPAPHASGSPVSATCHQLLLVHSSSWAAPWGELQRYEREGDTRWSLVGAPIAVNLGRNGLAWGRGLHELPAVGVRKTEGDGKSPAGAFALERAFGSSAALPEGAHAFPYVQTTATSYCVEDTRSEHYNELVDSTQVQRTTWEKWSELKRPDGLFDWAVVVSHNRPEPTRGAGSCVFMHVWRAAKVPTAGCTAMPRSAIATVLTWLDPSKQPVLVQLPEKEIERLREAWELP